MSRLDIKTPSKAQTVVDNLYRDVERRIAASPPGLCPVDMSLTFLQLCHAQTCGKCVPCRIGLGQLTKLIEMVLDGEADLSTLAIIEKTAHSIVNTADCAIGRDAARLVVDGLEGFRDDYIEHIEHHRCLASLALPVPCVALCPAGVDVPGYMALVGEGRCADAVRLIRKDNPMPTACAYICEHPCEARCRRNMIDAPLNIRGLKRYAVDHAGDVPQPECAPATGKTVAVIGGGPSGLSCAYYLALMGHKVVIFEERKQLGGMLRYGIPNYRFPREKLDAEINSILSLGIEAHTDVTVGKDITFEQLQQEYDCLYIAIGAHQGKGAGIPGEHSKNVMSAVEMLRGIGDGDMPDFTGKHVVVIGGGNVAYDTARSAKRLGAATAQVFCLEDAETMPADKEEVEDGAAEGVSTNPGWGPVEVLTDAAGAATGVVFKQCLSVMNDGKFAPTFDEDNRISVKADYVIAAAGQGVILPEKVEGELAKITHARGITGRLAGHTDLPYVFAGGDCLGAGRLLNVVTCVSAGKVAAGSIDAYLGGNGQVVAPKSGERLKTHELNEEPVPRAEEKYVPYRTVSDDPFAPCYRGLSDEEAHCEAGRCLRCDALSQMEIL